MKTIFAVAAVALFTLTGCKPDAKSVAIDVAREGIQKEIKGAEEFGNYTLSDWKYYPDAASSADVVSGEVCFVMAATPSDKKYPPFKMLGVVHVYANGDSRRAENIKGEYEKNAATYGPLIKRCR